MNYNIRKTNTWKAILVCFIILVIGILSDYQGNIGNFIVNYSVLLLGGSIGWWLYRYNWKARRKIKEEAIRELIDRGIIRDFYDSSYVTEKFIRRP